MDCTIIIPVIRINKLLVDVVNRCFLFHKFIKINVVYNSFIENTLMPKKVNLIQTNEINISSKRNIGVKKAKTKYIAFLDSDAYPEKNWFKNAQQILENDLSIGIVTGPELSFPKQSLSENIVGLCNRSYFITGGHNFRKAKNKSRFYSEASGCNIIMRKKDFESLNGMNPNIYLGEDREFSHRMITNLGKKIYFSKNVLIFHKDRGLRGFIIQRYARGFASSDLFLKIKALFKNPTIKNILEQRFETFIPLGFTLFLCSFPICLISDFWQIIFNTIMKTYLIIILLETFKLTFKKIYFFPFVYLFLILGTVIPGIAQLLRILKIKIKIQNFYRNTNDL